MPFGSSINSGPGEAEDLIPEDPTVTRMREERVRGAEGRLYEEASVNGHEMILRWDVRYNNYTIYFPQISLSEGAAKKVYEQVTNVGWDEGKAQTAFAVAKQEAEKQGDVYELYKIVNDFASKNKGDQAWDSASLE